MICPYARSSSISTWDWCRHQYFLIYGLGHDTKTNIKTEKGNIVHKVLECLAIRRLKEQENTHDFVIQDEVFGQDGLHISLCTPEVLVEKAFNYYAARKPEFFWSSVDEADCLKWVHKVLEYHDGTFNPLKRTVIQPEQHFDIPIDKPWAKYVNEKGEQCQFGIKGTIDLVCSIDENILELIDWKTGRRLNWGTGKEKDFNALSKDKQLMLYYYAATKLYPDKHVMVTIFYITDGGPFSLSYSDKDIGLMESMLEKYFKDVSNYAKPELHVDWRCKKFCAFGDKGGFNEEGQTKCQEVRTHMLKHGIDATIQQHRKVGYDNTAYSDGGGQSKEARQAKKKES